mmetsp:Transcript_8601/g.13582  ORF Transcript_8601/g.13582 Transcript_8601/m.13582 type:complete len:122 (+) Transcript_8601:510-875(+)
MSLLPTFCGPHIGTLTDTVDRGPTSTWYSPAAWAAVPMEPVSPGSSGVVFAIFGPVRHSSQSNSTFKAVLAWNDQPPRGLSHTGSEFPGSDSLSLLFRLAASAHKSDIQPRWRWIQIQNTT